MAISTNYSYPQQLAAHVSELWDSVEYPGSPDGQRDSVELPYLPVIESLISTCYQASLLREEERMVTFRIILRSPEHFPSEQGIPLGLHRLVFTELCPLTAHELKKLSLAANFHRSLIGVQLDMEQGPQIWGLVHSGPRWVHSVHGGRGFVTPLPEALVINVTGPGQLEVCKGLVPVGQLSEGRVVGSSMNVFESQWLQDTFAPIRAERLALHEEARTNAASHWASLDPDLTRIIDQNMLKRMIAAIRAFHHGGTLILVPPERANEVSAKNSYLSVKYKFEPGEPRARFRTLIVSIMNALAESGAASGEGEEEAIIGWKEYAESTNQTIAQLDEAIFEMSHLVSALSSLDGAVVMTKRFELLGFAAEIHSDMANVVSVAKALDLEGARSKTETIRGLGTRHRSAYALCHDLKDCLAIVISQDGGVQFVSWRNEQVMYWEHQATSAFSSRF